LVLCLTDTRSVRVDDCWTAFAGVAASPDNLFFISFFLMFAVRVSPYVACFTIAETFFEHTPVYFRRAWGMTAKDSALPDSRVAGVTPCPSSPEIKRPAKAGIKSPEKDGVAASALRGDLGGVCA
jgi:hypothetical protein